MEFLTNVLIETAGFFLPLKGSTDYKLSTSSSAVSALFMNFIKFTVKFISNKPYHLDISIKMHCSKSR